MAEELYIDPNLPEWKKKHLREQERRRLAALQQTTQEPSGPTPEQILAQRQAEEAEKARLASLQEEERKKRAAEEKARLKAEAQARMAQFAGSATQVEREEVLKELVPSKAKAGPKATSPRGAEPGSAHISGAQNVWYPRSSFVTVRNALTHSLSDVHWQPARMEAQAA